MTWQSYNATKMTRFPKTSFLWFNLATTEYRNGQFTHHSATDPSHPNSHRQGSNRLQGHSGRSPWTHAISLAWGSETLPALRILRSLCKPNSTVWDISIYECDVVGIYIYIYETWLYYSVQRADLSSAYHIFRHDRVNGNSWGVLLAVKNNLSCKLVKKISVRRSVFLLMWRAPNLILVGMVSYMAHLVLL